MKKVITFFLIGLLSGCTTITQIDKNYGMIYYKDGVSEKEAVFIAQKQCLQNSVCHGNVRISTPEIRDNFDEWNIIFRDCRPIILW